MYNVFIPYLFFEKLSIFIGVEKYQAK